MVLAQGHAQSGQVKEVWLSERDVLVVVFQNNNYETYHHKDKYQYYPRIWVYLRSNHCPEGPGTVLLHSVDDRIVGTAMASEAAPKSRPTESCILL